MNEHVYTESHRGTIVDSDDLISPPKNVSEKDIVKVLCKYCKKREAVKGMKFCCPDCEDAQKIIDKYAKKEAENASWYKK